MDTKKIKRLEEKIMMQVSFKKYNLFVTLLLGVILACQLLLHFYGQHYETLFHIFVLIVAVDIGVFIHRYLISPDE